VIARTWGLLAARLACLACAGCARPPGPRGPDAEASAAPPHAKPNVDGARELDQQGVRAFGEGRYVDAIRLFRTARALGGPPSEVWNVARCLERLDDAEGASAAIDEYLVTRDLSAQDRADAERESRALKARPSVLTVTTTPPGASVAIDGQPAGGPTPTSVEVRPGVHGLVVKRSGHAPESRSIEARFGRAVVIALDLAAARK
jgi:hypothetical protein